MAATLQPTADVLVKMDSAALTRFHWKIMFISGMGFFTDAYDLFIIGVVMALLKQEWQFSTVEEGLVTSTALLASAFGAILFGRIADMVGRKRIYGYEVLVLAIGAIASAFSPSVGWLIFFRIILGIGIGGDYPVSSTIMSEYSSKKTRGMMVTLVFAMQAAGLIFGPLLAVAMLASGLSHDLVWRLLLAFGAIPALAVFPNVVHIQHSGCWLAESVMARAKRTLRQLALTWSPKAFAVLIADRIVIFPSNKPDIRDLPSTLPISNSHANLDLWEQFPRSVS